VVVTAKKEKLKIAKTVSRAVSKFIKKLLSNIMLQGVNTVILIAKKGHPKVAGNTVYNIIPASFSFCICHQQQDLYLNDHSY
jgi:hypothetical protein